jgi:hypothetical protein
LNFQIFDNQTEYHLSCFGSTELAERVKLLYTPGCTGHRIPTPDTYKRIYLAKWTAFVTAFISVRKDMLLVDLDALLIKSPRGILADQSRGDFFNNIYHTTTPLFDIISSTDHGHSRKHFPYAHNWGDIRLCTGFILFRYSVDVVDLLKVVLAYQTTYGQVGGCIKLLFNGAITETYMYTEHTHTLQHTNPLLDISSRYLLSITR